MAGTTPGCSASTGARAVVVGAGSGIGRESALALAAHGAEVVCADRDLAAAQGTAGPGSRPHGIPARRPRPRCGRARRPRSSATVDVLVFTAATNVRKRVLDYSGEEFDRVVDLNLRASFDLVRAFGAGMAERGRGSIIGFSSIRAVTVEPGQGVYAATKAGLVQLLRTAAAELGPPGVRVNAVAPGVVETPLTAQIRAEPGVVRRLRRQERAGPVVAAGRAGRRGGLPRLGRVHLRHRQRAVRRRRLDRDRRAVQPPSLSGTGRDRASTGRRQGSTPPGVDRASTGRRGRGRKSRARRSGGG